MDSVTITVPTNQRIAFVPSKLNTLPSWARNRILSIFAGTITGSCALAASDYISTFSGDKIQEAFDPKLLECVFDIVGAAGTLISIYSAVALGKALSSRGTLMGNVMIIGTNIMQAFGTNRLSHFFWRKPFWHENLSVGYCATLRTCAYASDILELTTVALAVSVISYTCLIILSTKQSQHI